MKAQQLTLESAKRGDAAAIATLMQAPLVAKGITVSAHLKNDCLHVSLVGKVCPPKSPSLSFIRRGITHLDPEGIRAVRVDAYQSGDSTPGWVSRITLHAPASPDAIAAPSPSTTGVKRFLPVILGVLVLVLAGALGWVIYRNGGMPFRAPATQPAPGQGAATSQ